MKKFFNKSVAVLLSVALLVGGAVFTSSASNETSSIVLYTNDVHCATDGYAKLAAYRAELISDGYDVVTVDAGDAIQGEIIGSLTQGSAIVDIMNEVGYDYAVPGNHEFDYGTETLLSLAEYEAQYEYISCNFVDLRTSSTVFEPYYIEELNGEKVAFVGITTPEAYTKSTPSYFQDGDKNFIYSFSEATFYATVQSAVNSAIADGADRVIAVTHLGIDGTTEGWKSTDVVANTNGIDALIDAHSHEKIESLTQKNKDGEDVLISSTYTKFNYIGKLTLNADGSEKAELIDINSIDVSTLGTSAQEEYNSAKAKIDGYNSELAYLYEKLGTSETKLVAFTEDYNWRLRKEETNLGDFTADAYRVQTGADIAFANGGGIRAEIEAGDVTRKALMDINPWNNNMCVIEVTGQQILEALEHGASRYPETSGGFLQVSGLTYEINAYVESPVIFDTLGNFSALDETKENRIANVMVGGEKLDLAKTYTLAGNAYNLTQGGDGFTMFADAKILKSAELPTDAEMLIEYFTETLGGKITAEQYGNAEGDGRIKINETEPEKCYGPCHIQCPVIQFICKIFHCIGKFFGFGQYCFCGKAHW